MKLDDLKIAVGAFMERSRVNGPGLRAVLWVQGCPFRCPGCFNERFQPFEGREPYRPEEVSDWILGDPETEGVTFSGGEPFSQAEALCRTAALVRKGGKSVVIFTGHEKEELLKSENSGWRNLLKHTDLLVAGLYEKDRPRNHPLLSSANQELVFVTDRYRDYDWERKGKRVEIRVGVDGTTRVTGFPKKAVGGLRLTVAG